MSSISDSKYKVKFLNDIPESSDEIGIHEEIAKVIQNIIDNEGIKGSKKKVIGLFGSWGSGKSTVIEIFKKKRNLENNIFVFDSWSHRGNLLKRAFLIELARHLKVLDKEYKDKQDEKKLTIENVLSRKIVKRDIESNAKLDFVTKVISLILLLSIITVALSKIIEYLILPYIPISLVIPLSNFFMEHKLLVLVAVSIVFVLSYFILDSFVSFYFLKTANITELHMTKEDLEFTHYDYEKYLEQILKAAREKKQKFNLEKPLIIVFDNLDRVDDKTILNTLSLIQLTTEIIEQNLDKKDIFKNLYFLIPIDKDRLLQTIKNGIAENSNESFAEEFLKKIFPYEVNIPEVKHSNWRAFFNKMFKEAFEPSDKDNNELGGKLLFIRRIFEESIRSSRNNLTPREIKNFINSLVSNYLFWKDRIDIDIRLQALFVASRNYLPKELRTYILTELEKEEEKSNTEDGQKKLEQLIEIAKKEFNEDQVKEALLKQYYGVEEIYTLFVDKMIIAIRKNDIKEINQIFSMFKDRNKIERLVRCIWERADEYRDSINSLLSLSYCLRQSDLSEDFIFNDFYEKEIIPALQEQISDLEKLADLEPTMLEELIRIVQEKDNLKKLLIENSAEIIISYGSENEEE